jgi:hypothetical protein
MMKSTGASLSSSEEEELALLMEVAKRRKIRKSLSEWCRFCGYEPAKHHLLLECLEAAGIALPFRSLSGWLKLRIRRPRR